MRRPYRAGSLPAIVFTAITLALALVTTAYAATYYIAPAGSDQPGSGSQSRPFRSLQFAADRGLPGDVFLVKGGAYAPFHLTRSGTPGAPIVFRATAPDTFIDGTELFDERHIAISILASHVVVEGFRVRVAAKDDSVRSRGIRVSGEHGKHVRDVKIIGNQVSDAGWVGITASYADDIVIEKNQVWGTRGQHGIYIANSGDNPVVRGNIAHDNRQAGIQLNGDPRLPGDGVISGAEIAGNILYRNGRDGSAALNLASVSDARIVNNLLYGNFSQGIASWDDRAGERYGCKNNRYLHNTVVMPAGSRHAFSLRHGSTGAVVMNNIFIHLGERDSLAVDRGSLAGLKSDFNLLTRVESPDGDLATLPAWRKISGQDLHSGVANAAMLFIDSAQDDYRPLPGSAAVDRGTGSDVNNDLAGQRRPQGSAPDLGAYESVPPAVPPSVQKRRGAGI